jgi:uncharacterized protein YdhG (YjbR/CyaY superfamily)
MMHEVYVYDNIYGVVTMSSNKEKTTAEKIRSEVKGQSTRNLMEKVSLLIPGY